VAWLALAAAGSGSLVVLIKGAVAAGLNAETALVLRFTLGGLVWWTVLLTRRQSLWPGARGAAQAAGLGAFVYAPLSLTYYWGTARVPGSLAAMAVAGTPVLVGLLAWLFLRERLGWLGWLSLVLAVVGGVMLAGGLGGRADPVGFFWLGVAVLLYSLYIVLSTPLTHALSPLVTTAYVIAGAAAFYWLWGGVTGRIDFGFAPGGWAAVAGLALFSTVLAMFAFLTGAKIVGASRAGIVGALEPVAGVVLSVLFLGDRPGLLQIVGGGLIILAAVLVQQERVAV